MPNVLGVDYGTRRIGLAVAATETRVATPLKDAITAENPASDALNIGSVIDEYDVAEIVIGLPLNMDGTAGPQAEITRKFGDAVKLKWQLPVHYCDERLSTRAANDALRERGLTRQQNKRRRDGIAAAIILQTWLDQSA